VGRRIAAGRPDHEIKGGFLKGGEGKKPDLQGGGSTVFSDEKEGGRATRVASKETRKKEASFRKQRRGCRERVYGHREIHLRKQRKKKSSLPVRKGKKSAVERTTELELNFS